MDIDQLFKTPKLPGAGTKRKLPDNPTPEMLKRMRTEATNNPPSSTTNIKGKGRAVTVEEVEDEDGDSNFAPGGDADYFIEEDEEGRFYGGGLTQEQKTILNIFDSATGDRFPEEPQELSTTSVRRLLLKFERTVNKNIDQRSKYPDDPTKFIDSEADLDIAIKGLLPLAQSPSVTYPEIVKSGTVTLLMGLLSHENIDIVIDVVELLYELTDEDVGADEEDVDNNAEETLKTLVNNLVENSVFDFLVDNLHQIDEKEESDRQGVFHILGIFENIVGLDPTLSTSLISKTKLLSWLLNRIQAKAHDENRGYAAELLSILLQNNAINRLEFGHKDGVETVLKVLSQYRRRNPVDNDETEFMENLFDALCSALSELPIKKSFLDSEGPDLMVLIMKEKMQSKSRSIKTLDYAMSGQNGSAICEAFVEALGLKTLFAAFMGKAQKKKSASAPEDMTHILGIISSLFTNLPSESTAWLRLLAKFVENNYEKVDKLLDIRDSAKQRLKVTDKEIETNKVEMQRNGEEVTEDNQELWYLQRLDEGLFTLQTVDYILAWVIIEDDGIRAHALQMLDRKNQSLGDIVETLRTFHNNVGEPDEPNNEAPTQKQILRGLIDAFSI